MSKKVYLKTFGCQMNARDSEFAMGVLLEDGYKKANSLNTADVIIFNSCSVRKHAEDRLFSNLNDLKRLKKNKPDMIIGLMGCTAQSYEEGVFHKAPLVDFVVGPGNIADLPRVIKDISKERRYVVACGKVNEKRPELFPKYREASPMAYVSIGEGCNNFCSYCIVPYVRGRERSRDQKDIIREVKELAGRGFKDIMLLGQNVNSYGKVTGHKSQDTSFVKLLEKINSIKGIRFITFMTSNPKDASVELFRAIGTLEKVDKRLHLPLQSGSDRILKLMNRGYTSKKYLKLVNEYKKHVPGGSITTDVVVGFPSETLKDFNKTLELIELAGFAGGFAFKYSPRPPAKASLFPDDVSQDEKERRHKAALDALKKGARNR